METHTLELYSDQPPVHIALFQNVTNTADLRKRLVQQDPTLSCALVNAALVINRTHALAACNRAVHDHLNKQLKTHNIHSEIVFDFSPAIHIAQALRRFGIEDETQDVLVIKIGTTSEEAQEFLQANIQGTLVSLDDLEKVRDLKRIKKYYQVGGTDDINTIFDLVMGAMALKGI
ncbi:kinase binding protein CGI-121-domain-containing protein [Radiomyces spectabilis]|uniref:kinase binding protein CGI-121-domain-containing protein n=1 Tax=Radiomyces spectabilis TaxID=64574 RepID=UPI002220DCF9|nr:kinase binding protein CGI-121-domain-containing protein [Radiomyces spectabilis]KAI8374483.1 kinase binding protein CGI-121-domain-containing protein [Radiomyces spectabilis]